MKVKAPTVKGCKFVDENRFSAHGRRVPWRVGMTRRASNISLCERGFHWSETWADALGYAPGLLGMAVLGGGKIIKSDTKAVSETCHVLAIQDLTHEVIDYGIFCAERAASLLRLADIQETLAIARAHLTTPQGATWETYDALLRKTSRDHKGVDSGRGDPRVNAATACCYALRGVLRDQVQRSARQSNYYSRETVVSFLQLQGLPSGDVEERLEAEDAVMDTYFNTIVGARFA